MEYEIFRQSVAGWFLMGTFLLFAYPYLNLNLYSSAQWFVTGISSLILSPVLGYSASQIVRAFHDITRRRPNDRLVGIKFLHTSINQLLESEQLPRYEFAPLADLSPKDLNRFFWIAYANKDLRSRSESYWERYYTNLCIIFTSTCGAIFAFVLVLPLQNWYSYSVAVKWLLLLVFFGLLAVNNKHYLSIAVTIENTWIKLFIRDFQKNRNHYLSQLFIR